MQRLKMLMGVAALLGTSACQYARPERWRPMPVQGATEPSEVIAQTVPADWREIPAEDLLVIDLSDDSRVVVQLAPAFAPVHVANVRAFARGGWWNDATIYRVQDNYVAQWGNGDANVALPAGVERTPPAEYDQPVATGPVTVHASPDAYAPYVGYRAGWPIAWDDREGRQWLIHCYASVGVGRDVAPDTGTGGEMYAVIGHAPRHLDRNIAVVGRVIAGIATLASLPRGTGNLGFYERPEERVAIRSIRLGSHLPEAEQPRFEYLSPASAAFASYQKARENREPPFFERAAGGADICNIPVPVRLRAAK